MSGNMLQPGFELKTICFADNSFPMRPPSFSANIKQYKLESFTKSKMVVIYYIKKFVKESQ